MFAITNQVAAAGVAKPPKGITIPNTNASNAVMYSVPAGRKFIGRIGNTTNNSQTFINGMGIYCYHGGSTAVTQAGALVEMTLVAGTVVKESNPNTSYMWGVEYDL